MKQPVSVSQVKTPAKLGTLAKRCATAVLLITGRSLAQVPEAPAEPPPAPIDTPAPLPPSSTAPPLPPSNAAAPSPATQPSNPTQTQPQALPPAGSAPAPYPAQAQPWPQYPTLYEPPPPEAPWPKPPEAPFFKHKLSLQTEAAFSADEGPFYNHLLGGRYDFHTSRAVSFGGYLGYANLKGTGKRVHSVLALGQFAYEFYFGSDQRLSVPLRAGLGYLMANGVAVRFATGIY